jgi:hypothetical protein
MGGTWQIDLTIAGSGDQAGAVSLSLDISN